MGRLKFPIAAVRQVVTSARWFSLALLAISGWSLALIAATDDFYLTTVPVEGAVSIAPHEIVAASGLGGRHVFATDPAEAARQIGAVPGVISATVTVEWPNQVQIRIGEDSPVAVWEQAGQQYWVTDEGTLVPARLETRHLLQLESEEAEPLGEQTRLPAEVLEGALLLRELRPNIDHLYYRPGEGLSYEDGRGWRVYFGTGRDMAQKLVVYERLVEDLTGRAVRPEYISVVNQDKPYYMQAAG